MRVLGGLLAGLVLAGAAQAAPALKVETLSAPAQFVSGGRVLVAVTTDGARPTVTLNGRSITNGFWATATPGRFEGMADGLKIGANSLAVRAGAEQAEVTLTDYPITGPILSGPHQAPFICQTQNFKLPDGTTLGPATDADCSAPTKVQYLYKPRGAAGLISLADRTHTPADADVTKTLTGAVVPFVVRVETGTINRGVYQFAVLHDPEHDGAIEPRNPPKGWAHRLIAVHGTGCAKGWYIQGAALGVPVIDMARLGEGYALFTNTLNHPTNSCNAVLAGETTLMVKARVIETLGAPLYTLSMGGSGGAYTSLQVADAFPGLFDGVLVSATFPDALAIAVQASDAHLLAHYFRETAAKAFTPAQQQAVGGYGSPAGLVASGNQAGRTDPVPGRKDAPAYASAPWNDAVPQALRYDPASNPKGARPTVYDAAGNIYGRDPATGFARRPFDNVGVQYGLAAFNAGTITAAQFLDLNAGVGGYDQDANYVAARSVGDPRAIAAAYRSGLMLSGGGGLKTTAILDFAGLYTDLEPAGEYHLRHHHFSVRERLARWNGRTDNEVMWGGGVGLDARKPDAPPADKALAEVPPREGLIAMDHWLTALAAAPGPRTVDQVVAAKPKDLVDGCWTHEAAPRFIAEDQVFSGATTCNGLYPPHAFPRLVAGGPLSADVLKCALKPVDPADYRRPLGAKDLARLKTIFPSGVCDWTKPGQGQAPVQTWAAW
jgi:hypothetical protein